MKKFGTLFFVSWTFFNFAAATEKPDVQATRLLGNPSVKIKNGRLEPMTRGTSDFQFDQSPEAGTSKIWAKQSYAAEAKAIEGRVTELNEVQVTTNIAGSTQVLEATSTHLASEGTKIRMHAFTKCVVNLSSEDKKASCWTVNEPTCREISWFMSEKPKNETAFRVVTNYEGLLYKCAKDNKKCATLTKITKAQGTKAFPRINENLKGAEHIRATATLARLYHDHVFQEAPALDLKTPEVDIQRPEDEVRNINVFVAVSKMCAILNDFNGVARPQLGVGLPTSRPPTQ